MKITLRSFFNGREQHHATAESAVVIGRPKPGAVEVDFDLGDDAKVSRPHARLWHDHKGYWIEDLDSRHGTLVNGKEIRELGPHSLVVGDEVVIGGTRLLVLDPALPPDVPADGGKPVKSTVPDVPVEIIADRAGDGAPEAGRGLLTGRNTGLERRLALLCELPILLAQEARFNRRMVMVVENLVKIVPGAKRVALLMLDPHRDRFLLQACVPADAPAVSVRLARRAIKNRAAFVWQYEGEAERGGSILQHKIQTGMYAPVFAGGEAIGVLCVDNPERQARFGEDDLTLLKTVAQYASMNIGQHRTEETLRQQGEFTQRLFGGRFPLHIREKLLRDAVTDNLIGTRRSDVTVLMSDIRGFTLLSQRLGPQRMSDLLNEYFPMLTETIFRFSGSLGNFVGDAIFSVFGSPEPDDNQQENAVRAALEMQAGMRALSAAREVRRVASCEIGIGIDCGVLLNGFIGNAERMEFAVVGDAANFAQRYCSGAAPGQVIISESMRKHVWNLVDAEPIRLKAKHEGEVDAYVVKGMNTDAAAQTAGAGST